MTLSISSATVWAREVLAEAMTMARLSGDMPESAAEAHIYDCWSDSGALEAHAEAIEHATHGAVVLSAHESAPLLNRPF